MAAYDEDLAYIHDQGYWQVAEGAAASVLELLGPRASIVELGCGSGVTARRLTDAGHEVLGIDQSAALIALARRRAPRAGFRVGSFVSEPIPECDAVLAISEVFNYLFEERNARAALPSLFAHIHVALRPGGLLVFDMAAPASCPEAAAAARPAPIGPCSSRTTRRAASSPATSRASANAIRATAAARRSTASACTGRARSSRCCAPPVSVRAPAGATARSRLAAGATHTWLASRQLQGHLALRARSRCGVDGRSARRT
jgi:SAM-dependent methyltransferase